MPKLRKKHARNFTVVDNAVLQDVRLSYKARGLFVYLWHLPDNWDISLDDMVKHSDKDGALAVRTGVAELEKYGYLSFERVRVFGRFVDTEWTITEEPSLENQKTESATLEKPTTLKYYPNPRTIDSSTEENSLTTFESLSGVGNEVSPPDSPQANGLDAMPKKSPKKIPPITEDDWPGLRQLLKDFNLPIVLLDDNDWWNDLSYTCNNPTNEWLTRQFAKMEGWLKENPKKRPTTRWKTFVRGWLERAYERERKDYASQKGR